jgi:hypothetical protein
MATAPSAAGAGGAAAAAGAAAPPRQLLDVSYAALTAERGSALRAAVPALNDILEIRSDAPPARLVQREAAPKARLEGTLVCVGRVHGACQL